MSFSLNRQLLKYFQTKKFNRDSAKQDLSEIEKKILDEISVGKSYNAIAEELFIEKEEVQKHIRSIYEKLQRN